LGSDGWRCWRLALGETLKTFRGVTEACCRTLANTARVALQAGAERCR
jgi:hypothetical protein